MRTNPKKPLSADPFSKSPSLWGVVNPNSGQNGSVRQVDYMRVKYRRVALQVTGIIVVP